METVTHHQTRAAHFLALADSDARAGDFARAAYTLERAVSHAIAAANCHWQLFQRPTRRRLGHILFMLAADGYLSYASARWSYKFNDLHLSIAHAQFTGNRPAARRTLRNSHRRASRIIDAVNRAIAANPNPDLSWLNPQQ